MIRSLKCIAVTWTALWAISGSAARGGVIRHDRTDAAYTTLAADPRFAAVGKITGSEPGGAFLASGTLIRNQWVLTAAHVVDGTDGHGAGLSNLRFHVGGANFEATQWFVHPNWATSGGESNLFAGWDLGLVRLDQPVSSLTPANLFTGGSELGQAATIVGYGSTGTGLTGTQPNSAGTKRAGNNIVDISGEQISPGSTVSIRNNRMLAIDFDQPGNPSASTLGNSTPLNLEYLAAPGDSGGGLFIEVGGEMLLAGVNSLTSTLDGSVNSDYGDRAAFTRVSQFLSWIDNVIAENSPLISTVLPGDYNGDGVVEEADYTVWRDSLGQHGADLLADANRDGVVDSDDYRVWKSNFGETLGDGSGAVGGFSIGAIVPEPSALILVFIGVSGAFVIPLGGRQMMRRPTCREDAFEDIHILSEAEFYLLVGKDAINRLRRGSRFDALGESLNLSPKDIARAMRFAVSPNSLIMRALLDDWPWHLIVERIDTRTDDAFTDWSD
ncbi:MAG: trypsin-like serine protease [Pirellulales bacterium]